MKDIIQLGFLLEESETKPGIWERSIVEKPYPADISRVYSTRIPDNSQNISKKLNLSFSVYLDAFINDNLENLTYIQYKGQNYIIEELSPLRPKLTIRIGGLYNGQTETT